MLHVEQAPEQILQSGIEFQRQLLQSGSSSQQQPLQSEATDQQQLLQSETADVKSDIWSLGKRCCYAAFTKKRKAWKVCHYTEN
jgi:hypothetical protein